MPVFNCFFKIINKNKISILIYVVIFIGLFIIISSTSNSNTDLSYSDTGVPMAVIDRDESALSKALTGYLGDRQELVDLADDTEALQDALFFRDVEYILIIPDGFEDAFINMENDVTLENVKLPEATSGIYIDTQIDRYLATIRTYLNAEFELTDALAKTENDLTLTTTVELSNKAQENVSTLPYYFQFLPYILISLIISALVPVLMVFNQRDISKRTEASSLTLKGRNIQIALGCILPSLLLWGILMIAVVIINGSEVFTPTSALRILNSLVLLMVSVGIAFLLGQFLKSSESLSLMNNLISLGMAFLCGVFVPQELLGAGVLSIARFLPVYWYIRNNNLLTNMTHWSMTNAKPYFEGLLLQIGFAVALFAVALVVRRQKKFHPVV